MNRSLFLFVSYWQVPSWLLCFMMQEELWMLSNMNIYN